MGRGGKRGRVRYWHLSFTYFEQLRFDFTIQVFLISGFTERFTVLAEILFVRLLILEEIWTLGGI